MLKRTTPEHQSADNGRTLRRSKNLTHYSKLATRLAPRLLTSQLRIMPDFLIIGAAKSGTTSLYEYLIQHPSVLPAFRKEVYFFDRHFRKGITWYRAFFPTILQKLYSKRMNDLNCITGEATPCYMFHPHVPMRVFETVPEAKLIILLRNPVDRAYSFYQMKHRRGIEPLNFEEAIEREEVRLSGELEKMHEDENYASFNRQHYSYLSRGIYIDQIVNWTKLFPRDQILILTSEALRIDPSQTFGRVLEFLNLPHWEPKTYERFNDASYSDMNEGTRRKLREYFRPHNERLYEFLGMDLHWES